MKPIREAFPDCEKERGWFNSPNYEALVESIGVEICLQVDDHDYQGDSRMILTDGSRWGLLIFGWGSCSGCDGLQAVNNYEGLDSMRDELVNDIHWEATAAELLGYVENRDWALQYCWHQAETKQFIEDAKAFLKEKAGR